MAFDGITVAALVQELNNKLKDGRISKIAQPESDELLITIKTPRSAERLCLSANASLPLAYLTTDNKTSPMTAPNFCMLLRKHIGNARIEKITQPGLERIIQFELSHLNELGDPAVKLLIIELMGKHSNIIFCEPDLTIIDSIKHVSAQMSSVREVLPGRKYFIPDTMGKKQPPGETFDEFLAQITRRPLPLGKALYTGFTGISPVVAEEICDLSGIDSSMTERDLTEDTMHHLYRQFHYYMENVENGAFTPVVYYDEDILVDYSCLPVTHYRNYRKEPFSSVSEKLSSFYAKRNVYTRMRQKSADLRRIVQTALERSRKKYDLQSRQIRDTSGREKYKVYGELLHVYGYGLEPGTKELEALNYYTGQMIKIPLDPTKTAHENAARYFAKYNKQKRTFEALNELIVDTETEISYLESVSNALDIAMSEADLSEIMDELAESGYIKRKNIRKKTKFKNQPLHFISEDGHHIYVGKNNLQNEHLTFRFASGDDWWFHAKGAPGSHVIVKTCGEELSDGTFEEAGRLAAYYSGKRGSDKVEIDYVERKHVKKVNGAKPGFVIYHTNYSMVIDSDISKIRRVYD